MPAKPGPAFFLGLELATDQLRASIVDDSLELIGVECVDFDTEVSEYSTQGGIFTTPGEAYTTPVEMWIKGLDILLEKLHRNHDLTRIKCIGGSAQHALVWWKSTTVPSLSSLDPHLTLHAHFPSHTFSLPNTPIAQDTSSHNHALIIESRLGGPDRMAARVGACASASLIAAQLMRVREELTQDVWNRTGRVQLASAFFSSLIAGKWMPMSEPEACTTGLWGYWDEGILDIVGGNREEGRRVRGWLGEVDVSGGGRRAGNVSRYLVDRYGFDPDTIVAPFTSDFLSSYLSVCPSPNDAVLSFGPMDTLMTPAQHYIPTRLYSLVPHPAQEAGEKKRYIAVLSSRNADVPRALVRDMYTKSWSAFDRLVAIVPPGGSIGLDDKLFSFWHLQGDSYPFSHVKGIFRFETGIKVNEFRDLRANPRCLLESQILSFRVKWSRMIATGVLGARKNAPSPAQVTPLPGRSSSVTSSLGLPFDPYDHTPLPTRILSTGAAANFPSVSNLVGDVFNAPVFVPATQVDSAQVVPHRNAPALGAYVARWVWGRDVGAGGLSVFEDEMRRLLGKRWVKTGGIALRTNVGGSGGLGLSVAGGGSGANSGASTPYGGRSGLGATVFAEEEEDEEMQQLQMQMELERQGLQAAPGVGGMYSPFGDTSFASRPSAPTMSTIDTSSSGGCALHRIHHTRLGIISPALGANANGQPSTPTPLTPVVALATADAEAQVGLAKVAEPDLDAFMTYAAIVPEYCRLENMLVKGIV
ncbi:hypothetical protein BD779DRAFT_1536417 [Infundibulicybe gibba]|nr:hypothetical protein BD779DRAFT_1536417 [Infundibulicybe gibba]